MVKLFIGGFPSGSDELEIVKLFAVYGDVHTIKIVRDKVSKKSKGYAFLEMADTDAAENAIQGLDGASLSGRELRVGLAADKVDAPARPFAQKVNPPGAGPRIKRPRR